MTATRFALSSALVLTLSAFVCNAQRAPPDVMFDAVNLQYKTTEFGAAFCVLDRGLSQDLIEQSGNGQLLCIPQSELFSILDCAFLGTSCEDVKSVCDSLNGQLQAVSDTCRELEVPSEE